MMATDEARIRSQTADQERMAGPIHSERNVRIICVGAGASGLCFAYKLQRSFKNFSLIICACDIPAHNYTWSFEPKSDWSSVYAKSGEIYKYFNDFADKYALRQYIQTNKKVVSAQWESAKGGYLVEIADLKTGHIGKESCDILINAGGILNAWRWPAIPGLEKYKGSLLHSADWDDTVDLNGKHVGLIGNGSSGIQILPAILPKVKQITTFIREPTWVSPVQGHQQHIYSEQELHDFANKPGCLTDYRKANEDILNSFWPLFVQGTKMQEKSRKDMVQQMKSKLGDPYLESKLIPQWSLGCRRLTPGINYLESLSKDNVNVVYGEITEITEKGCKGDDGKEYPVDVLICATGFDTSFRPRFPLIGPSGSNLQDEWSQEAKGYMGIAAPNFPNCMIFLGPNCPIGNGPVLSAIEAQADYMLQFINRWQTENILSFAPKLDATEDFIAHTNAVMSTTVWADDCQSWYKNNSASGRVSALWPGSTLHYIEAMKEARFDDWNIIYSGNRFAWMGNGSSQTELDTTCDLSYYIREFDDAPYASRSMQRKVLTNSGSRLRLPTQASFF